MAKINKDQPNNPYPVDSASYQLPDGSRVIGRDAYEAELVRRMFRTREEVTHGQVDQDRRR